MSTLAATLSRSLGQLFAATGSRGAYPLARLLAFIEYSSALSPWRVVWVLLRTCAPPMALLAVFDVLPLQEPSEGWRASPWFWARTAANGFLCAAGILLQINQFVLDAPLSRRQLLGITLSVSVCYTSSLMALASRWVFPIPFTMTLSSLPFVVSFSGFLLLAIGTKDRAVLAKCVRFTNIVSVQTTMVVVYPGFHAAFLTLDGPAQVAFVVLLPAIKLLYKLAIARVSRELGDLRPAIIASVDLFDALYTTKCMQSAGSIWVGFAIIVLDCVQNCVAIASLVKQFRVLQDVHSCVNKQQQQQSQRLSSDGTLSNHDLLAHISMVLANGELLRIDSLRIDSRSLLTISAVSRQVVMRGPSIAEILATASPLRIASSPMRLGLASVVPLAPEPPRASSEPGTTAASEMNSLLLRDTMRLLHQSEAVVLVEYIETAVPIFYAIYLVILFHLPNAKFYQDVSQLTPEKLRTNVTNIMVYAGLELLSLVFVNEALKRTFGFSAFYQLAFTLESEWYIYQSNFNSWIVFIFQILLVHNGADYTFQFAWMRADQPVS